MGIRDIFSPSQERYQESIEKGLSRAYAATSAQDLVLDDRPLVFVSDLHKGTRDGVDDFDLRARVPRVPRPLPQGGIPSVRRRRRGGAMGRLAGQGHRQVQGHARTRRQVSRRRTLRAPVGNHDDLWRDKAQVAKHLDEFYPGLEVHEALKFRVKRGGSELGILFVVHGHQGTAASDSKSKIPRLFVRYVWRNIQRITKKSLNTPAKDFGLRLRHNRAMFDWARAQRDPVVMVAGHTHKPVFWKRGAGGFCADEARVGARRCGGEAARPARPVHRALLFQHGLLRVRGR